MPSGALAFIKIVCIFDVRKLISMPEKLLIRSNGSGQPAASTGVLQGIALRVYAVTRSFY